MAVSWSDGDLAQVKKIVSPESLDVYRNNMITANKQNPQRTGTEQATDLIKRFPEMQHLQQVNALKDVPKEWHLMKKIVVDAISDLEREGRLSLKPSKSKTLIDFISC